jgi:transposase
MAAAGLPLGRVNPRQARRLAEAIGRHAKTDPEDAAMPARLAAMREPPVRPAIGAGLDGMNERHVAGRALVKDRTAALSRGHRHRAGSLKRQAAQRLARIKRQIAAIGTAPPALLANALLRDSRPWSVEHA